MKPLITIALSLAIATFLTGYVDLWKNQKFQVGDTTVTINANGSDERDMLATHRIAATQMKSFADTYNHIAYTGNLPQTEICANLKKAANEDLKQREKSFAHMYDITCTEATGKAPELKMTIYPQVSWDYRFAVTFKPTP